MVPVGPNRTERSGRHAWDVRAPVLEAVSPFHQLSTRTVGGFLFLLYDFIFMKCPEQANPRRENRRVVAKAREGRGLGSAAKRAGWVSLWGQSNSSVAEYQPLTQEVMI